MSACPFDLDDVDLEDIEPYTGELEDLPEEVKECEKSIKEDRPDLTKSERIAICRDQLNMEQELSGMFQLAGVDTEPIEREEQDNDTVIYRNIKILQSGIWTDSGSRETIWYSPRGLENMEVTEDNVVNIMHDDDNEVMEAGSIVPDSLEAVDGALFADIELDTPKTAGELADKNLQKTLETQGAKGFGGPSVEIPPQGQEVQYNDEKGLKEFLGGLINGLGFVSNPASKPTAFARQVADRGVALSSGEQTKVFHQGTRHMADPEFRAQVLSHVDEDFTLQGAMDQIQDDAQAIADELDVGVDEVMEVLDPLLDMTDEEEEEEDMENEDDEEENEGEDEEEEDDDMDMQDRVDALEERLTNVEDMVESAMQAEDFEEELSEELEDAKEELADAETVQELEEAKDDLEKRLSELEDEPGERKTLADREGMSDREESSSNVTLSRSYDPKSGTISR